MTQPGSPGDYHTPVPPPAPVRRGLRLIGWILFIGLAAMLFTLLQGDRRSD